MVTIGIIQSYMLCAMLQKVSCNADIKQSLFTANSRIVEHFSFDLHHMHNPITQKK